ncbi:MAG TPA: hypothetical protein VH650_04500 [Gaiellaceae bacterium]|jgi:hypothetical protein
MATKADFTEEEWETMQKGVTGAGMLVSLGDKDFSDSFGEAGALAKYLAEQRDQNASELMREVAHVHGSGFGFTASQQEVETDTAAALRSAVATLGAKAPEDAAAYRQLVLGVAETVAEAKGGVKPGETAAIAKIEEALA